MNEPAPPSSPLSRLRFFGIRKLNWAERNHGENFQEHMAANGFDRWLTVGALTIVVGPNGGGKSSVIDLLRALADPDSWPGLPRENYPGDDFSGFDVEGRDWTLSARFSKFTPEANQTFDYNTAFMVGYRGDDALTEQFLLPKYPVDGSWRDIVSDGLSRIPAVTVRYLPAVGRHPGADLTDAALAALLNELAEHFPSVFANPKMAAFKLFKGGTDGASRIGIFFKDDGGQHAFVHRDTLPLGWLQLASVLAFIRDCPPGALVLLDEPDRHLHPSLQRAMLELVARESRARSAQVVLATHSSVLINPELCAAAGAAVWVTARGRCEPLTDSRRVLDDLGVTSGDLVQANGIIWVEGPSDRVYLKTWLELRARAMGQPVPIERVHYMFVSYGGALIKHVTLSDAPDRVALLSVNRNFAFVVDRDLPGDVGGAPTAEKRRILAEAERLGQPEVVWITQRYTIENYLPEDFAPANLIITADSRTVVTGCSKMELAQRFRNRFTDWGGSYAADSDLEQRIDALLERIHSWQTPQEIIEPAFLPPFLTDDNA